ncbi:MAG: 50S ribosome-binding GTPase [Planctomycetota bacterium]|jgi:sulfate adenylyltransferase large subunit|nr:50S ribosome-binding GTPase [Planctomycetota bacterium]
MDEEENPGERLKLVVTGHVDHGKSTVIGRLLHDTGFLPAGALEKAQRIAHETGKPFEFAYLLDAFEEEQKQGITIDTTRLNFATPKRGYVIIDAPGHQEFLKNMISGAADAEAALLVVDASRGVEEQSRRHAYLLSLLGIRQIGVVVNKMDLVAYGEAVFRQVETTMADFLASLGLVAKSYIPLSGLLGENILEPSSQLPWYSGPTLLTLLDSFSLAEGTEAQPLRLPLQDIYKFDDRRILAGRIASGTLRVGDTVRISPGGRETRSVSLEEWGGEGDKSEATSGESVGITLADEFFHQRGEVISHPATPPLVSTTFRANLFWMGRTPLRPGKKYILKIATRRVECEVSELGRVIDASSLTVMELPQEVRMNGVAEVAITTGEAIALDLFSVNHITGRFVLVDGYDVVGGGIVSLVQNAIAVDHAIFEQGKLQARCELFDEFFYSVEDYSVNKRCPPVLLFRVGDPLPLEGKSYSYPEFFDIAVMRDKMAVKIRAGRVVELQPLADLVYSGLPMVNGRGFAFRVKSREEWRQCQEEYAAATSGQDASLSAKWLDFHSYRRIYFASNSRS